MAITRPDYECLWADVGCNGSDGWVWNKSGLHQCFKDGTIKLPKNDSLLENHRNIG